MKYTLTVETTPQETAELVGLFRDFVRNISRGAGLGPSSFDSSYEPEEDALEPEPEAPAPLREVFVARESRQSDTPEAYGDPLEFRVKPAETADELERAWEAWSEFLAAWCSPFSADGPEDAVTYPDRAAIIRDLSGTLKEGRIKQEIARHGSVNKAVLMWLVNYPFGPEHFSSEDRTSNLADLADRIAGSIAQLASILMPELIVMYDISPSWRKDAGV